MPLLVVPQMVIADSSHNKMDLSNLYNQQKMTQTAQSTAPLSKMYTPPPVPKKNIYSLKNRGVDITDDDLSAIRPLIYGEVSNRDISKKELEANVIFNTAINRAREYSARNQPKTISEIIAMPNQYQAYGGKQYNLYNAPSNDLEKQKKIEVDMIIDKIAEQIRNGTYDDNTEGAYYYIHTPDGKIQYDNKRKLFK